MVTYAGNVERLAAEKVAGFFVGWPNPPDPERFVLVLRSASHVVLAWDGSELVGFVYAISDAGLAAYVPLLEVRPEYQGQGIGSELMRRILAELSDFYMIDVVCDGALVPFYERLDGQPLGAVSWRNRDALVRSARVQRPPAPEGCAR